MAFYCNGIKVCEGKQSYNQNIRVRVYLKIPEFPDKFNNTIFWEQQLNNDINHHLIDYLYSMLNSKILDEIPWNRYEFVRYEYENGNEARLSDNISENTIINMIIRYKDIPVYYVDVPHVQILNKNLHFNYNSTEKISSFTKNNLYVKYDEDYGAGGEPLIEELVLNTDNKSESWMPAQNTQTIDNVLNILCVNPIRVTLKVKYMKYTVTFNYSGHTPGVDPHVLDPKIVRHGEKIDKPDWWGTKSSDKYIINTWYTDPSFKNVFDFNTPITNDITLYGKWEKFDY